MSLREKTNRLEVVLTLLLIQLILLPAALGVTYASSGTRPEHILTYTTGRLTWDSATETDGQGAARLELFRRSYDNVNAADGQNVIAPGTAGETVVRLKNNTGRTVSYTAVLYEKKTNAALPVTSALTGEAFADTTAYVLPDGVDEGQVVRAVSGTVGGNQRQDFSILWSWLFEVSAQQNAADTALGNAATDVEELGFYLTVTDQGGSGGTVIDPETLRRFRADVLCDGEKIEAIFPGGCDAPCGVQTLDAAGCFVCPGFIDPHGHIDGCKHTGTLSLLQGITTTVGGNCGFSPLDIDAFLRSQTAFPIHQAEMIGLCALLIVFGVLSTVNLAIGQVTPPVGVNLFVAIGVADKLQGLKDKTKVTIATMSKAVWPMIMACVITLLIVTYVPFFSTVFLKG